MATFAAGFDWVREFRLLTEAAQTLGTVTSREPEKHNLAHYDFKVNGHRYVGADQGGGASGDAVIVYYLPDDPTFSRLKQPGNDLAFMIVAPLVLSILAGFGVRSRVKARRNTDSGT